MLKKLVISPSNFSRCSFICITKGSTILLNEALLCPCHEYYANYYGPLELRSLYCYMRDRAPSADHSYCITQLNVLPTLPSPPQYSFVKVTLYSLLPLLLTRASPVPSLLHLKLLPLLSSLNFLSSLTEIVFMPVLSFYIFSFLALPFLTCKPLLPSVLLHSG